MDKISDEGTNTSHKVFLSSLHANQKLMVLKIALSFAIVICVVFIFLNLNQGNTVLTGILIVETIVYLFLLYLIIRSNDFLKPVSLVYILFFFAACSLFYNSPQAHVTVFLWSIVCYFLAHFFLESKLGSVISILFFVVTLILLLRRYFINTESIPLIVLCHLVAVNIGALVFAIYYEKRRENAENELTKANQQLENMANRDGLTGLFNRRYFNQVLQNEWLRLQRSGCPLSLILSDIDYFKKYNDHYGHVAGDACLKNVADAFKNSIQRVTDVAARYGGEEFAVILPDTDSDGTKVIAQSIKDAIKKKAIPHKASQVKDIVSMSFGIATVIPNDSLNCESFIEMADKVLYQSKENGRDMISIS